MPKHHQTTGQISGEHSKKRGGLRRKEGALSQIMKSDNFLLCVGGFLLVAVCLAGYGVVLASRMEFKPQMVQNIDNPLDVKSHSMW